MSAATPAVAAFASALFALTGLAGGASAQTGFYAGAGLGLSSLQADIATNGFEDFDLDENEFAWKAFAGFNLDVPFVDFAVEGGYVDLGSPSVDVLGENLSIDATGWNAFAVGAVDVGPLALFAKLGLVAWDAEVTAGDFDVNDDGTDIAYGVGARIGLGPIQLRGEAEFFEIDAVDSSYLISASAVWQF
jgi:hypothetical protein